MVVCNTGDIHIAIRTTKWKKMFVIIPHKTPTIRPLASHHENYTKLDEPDTQDTAGEARTNSSVMYSYWPPHMAKQKQDNQLEHT